MMNVAITFFYTNMLKLFTDDYLYGTINVYIHHFFNNKLLKNNFW